MKGLQAHAEFLNNYGYATLVVDSFSARDYAGGAVCESINELGKARHYRQYDAINALLTLQAKRRIDPDNIFFMGQSNGGSVALGLAEGGIPEDYPEKPNFRALVAYYPWCGALKSRIRAPLLVLGGELDDWVSPDQCVEKKDGIKGAEYDVTVYPSSHHSFDLDIPEQSYAGHTVGGNPQATAKSRQKMLEWFNQHLQ